MATSGATRHHAAALETLLSSRDRTKSLGSQPAPRGGESRRRPGGHIIRLLCEVNKGLELFTLTVCERSSLKSNRIIRLWTRLSDR
jgi:hypothetical protein